MLKRVEGELDALEQILARKTVVMARELPSLKKTIITQEAEVQKRIDAIFQDWNTERPVSGSLRPSHAVELVSLFELKLRRVAEEFEKVVIVKECLDIPVPNKELLKPLFEQCSDLKTVW